MNRNRKITQILVLAIATQCALAQPRQLCITVDDLPTVAYGADNHAEITNKLVAHFQKYDIPAIGFVNEGKLYYGGELRTKEVALLKQWLDGGYELGNHTFGHNSYHQVIFSDYTADVLKGAVVTPPLSKKAGLPWRYFRHPYLQIGKSQSAYDSLATFLTKNNYIEAPVTIDNTDYLFAQAYAIAQRKKDTALMQRIGTDYVAYMEAKVHFYEGASRKLFDREIPQVLLIHASLLNADYLDDLAKCPSSLLKRLLRRHPLLVGNAARLPVPHDLVVFLYFLFQRIHIHPADTIVKGGLVFGGVDRRVVVPVRFGFFQVVQAFFLGRSTFVLIETSQGIGRANFIGVVQANFRKGFDVARCLREFARIVGGVSGQFFEIYQGGVG